MRGVGRSRRCWRSWPLPCPCPAPDATPRPRQEPRPAGAASPRATPALVGDLVQGAEAAPGAEASREPVDPSS